MLKIAKIYVAVCYLNSELVGLSIVAEKDNGELAYFSHKLIKLGGVENEVARSIRRVVKQYDMNSLAFYSDNFLISRYIERLISDEHYDEIKRLKYQPRGRVFTLLRERAIKIMLFKKSKTETMKIVEKNSVDLVLKELNLQ